MPYYHFIWNDENEAHVAEHGITPDEFEEVVCEPDELKRSRSSGRPIAFGETSTGKYIACVFELLDDFTIIPVTAFEIED